MNNLESSNQNQPNGLGRELIEELMDWFLSLLKNGIILPKIFTGVNCDGRQYLVDMSRLQIDTSKHHQFMRHVIFREKSVAFAFKMRTATQLGDDPEVIQEQHLFYSGSANSYHSTVLASKTETGWQDGCNILHESHSTELEIFFQDLLPEHYKPTDDDELFGNIWDSIRDKVVWRNRT